MELNKIVDMIIDLCESASSNDSSFDFKIANLLRGYDQETLRELVALMYLGRGDFSSFANADSHVKNNLDWNEEQCIAQISEKSRDALFRYFSKAKRHI